MKKENTNSGTKLSVFKILKKIFKWTLFLCLFLILLVAGVVAMLHTSWGQTKAVEYVTDMLNEDFGTQISIGKVEIDWFGDILLYEVAVKDDRNLKFIDLKKVKATTDIFGIIKNPDIIHLKKLHLYEPYVQVYTYRGDEESNFIKFINAFDDGKSNPESKFQLSGSIGVSDGKVLVVNQNNEKEEQIRWDAKNLNFETKDFNYYRKNVEVVFEEFNFDATLRGEEYRLEDLNAKFHYGPDSLSLSQLNLKTQSSVIKGDVIFKYDKPADLSSFVEKVNVELNFPKEIQLAGKDIRYFSSNWDSDTVYDIIGLFEGKVQDLSISDYQIKAGQTLVTGNTLLLTNVLDDDREIIAQNIRLQSSYKSLKNSLPKNIASNIDDYIANFGDINYNGSFALDEKEITTQGKVITSLGVADIDAKIMDYTATSNIRYVGSIGVQNLNLAKLTHSSAVNHLTGTFYFDGKGTQLENLQIGSRGDIASVEILGKTYQNFKYDGVMKDKQYQGKLSIRETYLSLDYDGLIDFRSPRTKFDFEADVFHAALPYFGLSGEKINTFKGKVNGTMSLNSIEDLQGDLYFKDLSLIGKEVNIPIKEAHVSADLLSQNSFISAEIPEYMNFDINGQFLLKEIPKNFVNAMAKIIQGVRTVESEDNQIYTFNGSIAQDLISYFVPDLYISPNTRFDGLIHSNSDDLFMNLTTPGIKYRESEIFGTNIDINTLALENLISLQSDSLSIEGFKMKDFELNTNPIKDSLKIDTHFYLGKNKNYNFDLHLKQSYSNDLEQFYFTFSNSTITVNDAKWEITQTSNKEENNVLFSFKNDYFKVANVKLISGGQQIELEGEYFDPDDFNFDAFITNVQLSKIIPREALGDLNLEGLVEGEAHIIRTPSEFNPIANFTISDILLNDYNFGTLTMNTNYEIENEIFNIEGDLQKDNVQTLVIQGYIDNKEEKPKMDVTLNFDELPLDFANIFLEGVMSNIRGLAAGNLDLKGNLLNPEIYGNIYTTNLGFMVDYLGVDFTSEEEAIFISKPENSTGFAFLNNIKLIDTYKKTEGYVVGGIYFDGFSEFYLDLKFDTERLLVLNTTQAENELFYGSVYAGGEITLIGDPSSLELGLFDIRKKVKILPGSFFTFNTSSTSTLSDADFVYFIPQEELTKGDKAKLENPSNFAMDIRLEVDENSKFILVFDDTTDDQLEARGFSENLHFEMTRGGEIIINGSYEITEGKYQFRQVPLLSREFYLREGSSVVWRGNPYNADLDITAFYNRQISNLGQYLNIGNLPPEEVDVVMYIKDELVRPEIKLDLDLPKSSGTLTNQLKAKLNSEDEIFNQAASILLTNQFNVQNNIESGFATNNVAGNVLRILGRIITDLISELDVDFTYTASNPATNSPDILSTVARYRVSPRLDVIGVANVPLESTVNNNFSGSGKVNWDISDSIDRSLVLSAFSRPNNFGFENNNNTGISTQQHGVGITWKYSLDYLPELFNQSFNPYLGQNDDYVSIYEDNFNPERVKAEARLKYDSILKSRE